jgi:hypothetical protein
MAKFFGNLRKKAEPEQTPENFTSGRITFVVPDRNSLVIASNALAKVRLPEIPRLKTLQDAYMAGEKIIQRLDRKGIRIVEKQGASPEDAFKQNADTYRAVAALRNEMATLISDVVHPGLKAQGKSEIDQHLLIRKVIEIDQRLAEMERMMKEVHHRVPEIPAMPGDKQVFRGQLKEAGQIVQDLYRNDLASSTRQYKDLRDASNSFYYNHIFAHKPDLTKDQFYENVKKVA